MSTSNKPPPKPEGESKRQPLKLSFSTDGSSPLPVAEHPRLIGVTRVNLFVDGAWATTGYPDLRPFLATLAAGA